MNFEPKKFFIGVIDFFSVLLPGALLTWRITVEPKLLAKLGYDFTGTAGWLAFLFASYVLGHFIFLVGAAVLDDFLYDPLRDATKGKQAERRAKGEGASPAVLRWLAEKLIKEGADDSLREAIKIKEHYVNPLGPRSGLNAFQWCKARLTLENRAEALESVLRFEADSKFFRSFAVVIFLLLVWEIAKAQSTHYLVALVGVPFLALALWRYVDQRLKSINQAYWYIIALEAANPAGYREASEGRPNRAGGVVYRGDPPGGVQYLLVQAKGDPNEWVLPKGHIEPEEKTTDTAMREVFEETGIYARIRRDLGTIFFDVTNETVRTQFFLMESVARDKHDEARLIRWAPLDEAVATLNHDESRDLLRRAQAALTETAPKKSGPAPAMGFSSS